MPTPADSVPPAPSPAVASGALSALAFGAALGAVGYAGWFLCAPRSVGVLGLTPTPDGRQVFTFDHLDYVSGPAVVPALAYLMVMGAVAGLVFYLVATGLGRGRLLPRVARGRRDLTVLAGYATATGAAVGALTAVYSLNSKPLVTARLAVTGGDTSTGPYPVVGGPPYLDPGPLSLVFPLAGVAGALVIALGTNAVLAVIGRRA